MYPPFRHPFFIHPLVMCPSFKWEDLKYIKFSTRHDIHIQNAFVYISPPASDVHSNTAMLRYVKGYIKNFSYIKVHMESLKVYITYYYRPRYTKSTYILSQDLQKDNNIKDIPGMKTYTVCHDFFDISLN